MTFYSVHVSSSNISGSASGMETLLEALRLVEEFFPGGDCRNAEWCDECQLQLYSGGNPIYHSFLIREHVALKVIKSGHFSWTKKKGIGRRNPIEYLEGLVNSGTQVWFQLEMSEI